VYARNIGEEEYQNAGIAVTNRRTTRRKGYTASHHEAGSGNSSRNKKNQEGAVEDRQHKGQEKLIKGQ
jgi:hypothetical protein